MENDLAKLWAKRIEEARDVHRKEVVQWSEKIIKEYAGDFKSDSDTGERYEQVAQVIHSVEETIQPHLLLSSPKIFITAKNPKWDKRTGLVEAVLNNEYRDILPNGRRLEVENDLALLDARLLPYGGTKTMYLVKGSILEEPAEKPGFMDKMKGLLTGEEPEVVETPVIEDEKGHVTERFDPLKVMIDPNAKHITKIKYVIEELELDEEELKSPRYDKAMTEKMKPDCTADSSAKNLDERQLDNYFKKYPDNKRYRVYEIHDLVERKIHTYSEQLKDFLEMEAEYPVDEGSVYSFLYFIEAPNKAYPIPPIKFYRKRAIEFSYIYSQVAKQIDKFLPKIGVDGTKLSSAGKERLKAGNLATVIETVGNPAGVITQYNFTIQRELFQYLEMIKGLMNLESGVNDYEMANPENRKATEATQINAGTQARRLKPKKRVKEFLVNQAHIIWLIISKNQSIKKFIKVIGQNEALEWWQDQETGKMSWTGEDLRGDYAFDIDIDSITPQNEAVRKKQNMEGMLTVMRPDLNMALQQEGKKLKISGIFEKFAKENLGIDDRSKIIEDLTILKPEQEHDRWMQGQFPPIQQGENLEEHLAGHTAWIRSPLFQFLPEEVKAQALKHGAMTEQAVMQRQAQMNPNKGAEGESPREGAGMPDSNTPNEMKLQTGASQA